MREDDEVKEFELYLCGVDWQHEIGHAADGNMVYPGLECIKKYRRCTASCGVVKVKARFELIEWSIPQNIGGEDTEPTIREGG